MSGIYPPDIGGPATHASDLATELRARGHHVTVLSQSDRRPGHPTDGLVLVPRSLPWPARATAAIAWLVRNRRRYDVIYATGMGEAAVPGAKLARRPVVLKFVGDPAWERSVREGLTEATYDSFQHAPARAPRERAMRALRDWTARHATAVMTPSGFLAESAARWGRRHDVAVIPNGVRLAAGTAAASKPGERLRTVYVGRLVEHKRIQLQLEALARCEGVDHRVIGDGPARGELESLARRLGISSRVEFLGALDHETTLRHIATADALMLTSEYEGLPHVVIEALACGTPVVTVDVGGTLEALEPGVDSVLVPHPTAESLADTLRSLRDDPNRRAALREGARRRGARFRFDHTADAIEALLASTQRDTDRRPSVIFLGKNPQSYPPSVDETKRFSVLARHLRLTSISVGRIGSRRVGGAHLICLPALRPRLLGGLLFYAAGPPLALTLSLRRRRPIVCQSPYEAAGVLALRALVPFRRPKVQVEVHGDWAIAARLYGGRTRRLVAPLADRLSVWSLRRADRVRVVSDALGERVRQAGYRGPLDTYVTFSDFGAFLDRPPDPLPAEPAVLYVGVLEPTKGVDVLLEAWPKVARAAPEATLSLVGTGSGLSAVDAALAQPALHNATRRDPVSRAELSRLIDGATCLVLPSRSEGLPRILIEAMARGRAVVATRVGGIPEIVHHGTNGLLVEPEDSDALACSLIEIIANPPRAARMGAEARRFAEQRDPSAEYDAGVRRLADWARCSVGKTRDLAASS